MGYCSMMLNANCLCQGIRFKIEGAVTPILNCHCHRCRRFTGHFLAATSCTPTQIIYESGARMVSWFEAATGVHYGSCAECGSSLFFRTDHSPSRIAVAAGLFDPPTGLETEAAWWIDEASDYHCRQEGIREFPRDGGIASVD